MSWETDYFDDPDFVNYINKMAKPPKILINEDGMPTKKFIKFVREYKPSAELPLMKFLAIILEAWEYNDIGGFILRRKYNNKQKLELHTFGNIGNIEIINAMLDNIYLSLQMKYVAWQTGGHYYFELSNIKKNEQIDPLR